MGNLNTTDYARSILGITEADARTARNIHLTVADCRHLRSLLKWAALHAAQHAIGITCYPLSESAQNWNQELSEYLKGAV